MYPYKKEGSLFMICAHQNRLLPVKLLINTVILFTLVGTKAAVFVLHGLFLFCWEGDRSYTSSRIIESVFLGDHFIIGNDKSH